MSSSRLKKMLRESKMEKLRFMRAVDRKGNTHVLTGKVSHTDSNGQRYLETEQGLVIREGNLHFKGNMAMNLTLPAESQETLFQLKCKMRAA